MKDKSLTYKLAFSLVCGLLVAGCENKTGGQSYARIAVTNSYLACAVRQLCGDDTEILCLTPPGMCPGHFDISPLQVKQLCHCEILLLFDFQRQVEETISRLKERGLKTALVKEASGLCVPETYISVCRDISDILSSQYPEKNIRYRQKLAIIEEQMKHLREELLAKVKQGGGASEKVLVSKHQADFVRWLGLEPIETFVGSDIETVAGIEQCIKKAQGRDVRFVIANKQEGTALAKAIAERLGARVVVFSNFPKLSGDESGFSELLRENVNALLVAAKQ